MKTLSRALLALALLGSSVAAGCATGAGEDDELSGPRPERARYKNLSRSGRDVAEHDLNRDTEPDQWAISAGGRLLREERDMNFDGAVDVYLHYSPSGDLLEEEMDLDVDGLIDVVNIYRSGVLVRKEMSIDFRGQFSVVKYYATDGTLSRIERDSNEDGKVDTWEYFQDNKLIRVGRDVDRDGSPDVFKDATGG